MDLSFEQRIPRDIPPHVVYFSESQDLWLTLMQDSMYAAPGDWLPEQVVSGWFSGGFAGICGEYIEFVAC